MNDSDRKAISALAGCLFHVLMPFVLILALNTLVPALAIPVNFGTWFAAFALLTLVRT